jgi:hypothetical protein
MRNLKKSLLAIAGTVLLSASTIASAGYVNNATITRVRASEFNVYYVYVDVAIVRSEITGTVTSTCSSGYPANVFAFDTSTVGGKAMLNTILVAKAAGSLVNITGRGSPGIGFTGALVCNLSPGSTSTNGVESINALELL